MSTTKLNRQLYSSGSGHLELGGFVGDSVYVCPLKEQRWELFRSTHRDKMSVDQMWEVFCKKFGYPIQE